MSTRWFVFLSVVLAATDQLTKYMARAGLMPNVRYEIVPDFLRLSLNFNKGIAWGMLPEWSEYFTYFAIIMVLVILMILRKLDKDEVWLKIALAFQMAGAIGNMTDRIIRRQVTDFLDVTLFPHTNLNYSWQLGFLQGRITLPYDWPIFNLADSFVVCGTVVLVLVLLMSREPSKLEAKAVPAKVRGGLGAFEEERGWDEWQHSMGNIPPDEGLTELPAWTECGGMLEPLEEVERVREEKLGESPFDEIPPNESPLSGDRDKLDELSAQPGS